MKQYIWLDGNEFKLGPFAPENKLAVHVHLPKDLPIDQELLRYFFENGQIQVV